MGEVMTVTKFGIILGVSIVLWVVIIYAFGLLAMMIHG